MPLRTGLQLLLACSSHPGAAFGPWSHPSLPWDWGLGPGWRTRSGILLAGAAQGKAVRCQPLLALFLQARFTVGMFTVYPGFGSIPPGGQQMITVDCYAEPLGTCREHLSIDISDRDPKDNPLGIPYTLFAESCLPGTPRPQVPMARPAADQHLNLLLDREAP